jgi:hypothetical protein
MSTHAQNPGPLRCTLQQKLDGPALDALHNQAVQGCSLNNFFTPLLSQPHSFVHLHVIHAETALVPPAPAPSNLVPKSTSASSSSQMPWRSSPHDEAAAAPIA